MKFLMKILITGLCGLMSHTAYSQSPGQAVPPGQLFAGELLNVHAPGTEGWLLAGAGGNGMAFAKRGSDRNETYAAQVILFKLPQTNSNDEFVKVIKDRVDMVNPPPRFVALEVSAEYTDHRGYPSSVTRAFMTTRKH